MREGVFDKGKAELASLFKSGTLSFPPKANSRVLWRRSQPSELALSPGL